MRDKKIRDKISQDYISFLLPGDKGYPYPFIKAINKQTTIDNRLESDKFSYSIWVDVFPLDHFPDGKLAHLIALYRNKLLRGALNTELMRNGPEHGGKVIRAILSMLNSILGGYEKIVVRMDDINFPYQETAGMLPDGSKRFYNYDFKNNLKLTYDFEFAYAEFMLKNMGKVNDKPKNKAVSHRNSRYLLVHMEM